MKHLSINLLFLLCLLVCAGPSSGNIYPQMDDSGEPIKVTLNQYRENGYKVLMGPVQYLGKTKTHIMLYRQNPLAYQDLKVINENGRSWFVKKGQFVYVLSKKGRIVLIHIGKKEVKDA